MKKKLKPLNILYLHSVLCEIMPKDSTVSPETTVKMRKKDHAKIKTFAKKHGITITEALGDLIESREVKKVATEEPKSKEIELAICDNCEEDIPIDASFCPYCGVEFEEDEDEDEE
jgi:uncharacterized protein with PIN domain